MKSPRSSIHLVLSALLAACGASSPPPAPPAAVPPLPELPASEPQIQPHAQPPRAALEPHCGDAYTFCSLTGCGDGKTLCETIAMDEQRFIKDIVHGKRALFSRCFADYLKLDPTADGIVRTRFTIDAQGAVAVATATGIHPSVEACVVTALRTLRFADLAGRTTEVSYPFVFHRY